MPATIHGLSAGSGRAGAPGLGEVDAQRAGHYMRQSWLAWRRWPPIVPRRLIGVEIAGVEDAELGVAVRRRAVPSLGDAWIRFGDAVGIVRFPPPTQMSVSGSARRQLEVDAVLGPVVQI
jgi:hypothetical protein